MECAWNRWKSFIVLWGVLVMNDRFFNNVITIYNKKEDDSFQRTVINKVYVRKTRKITINSNGEEVASSASITIPTKIAKIGESLAVDTYKKDWFLNEGDYIVDDSCDLDFDITKIKKQFDLFQIINVSDNRKGNLQHFKIEVSE